MNAKALRFGVFILLLASRGYAQMPSAETVYRAIEYREEFSDREVWVITDAKLVRTVITRLIAGNALADTSGTTISSEMRHNLARLVSRGDAVISCSRRRYDEHLDRMMILAPSEPGLRDRIAPIEDWVYMSDLLGEGLYALVRSKQYAWSGTTGDEFDARQQFSYDLYLSALDPHAMIWQTTRGIDTKGDPERNFRLERWMASAWASLGFDQLNLPFWFKGTGCAGIEVAYVDDAYATDRDYTHYSIKVGIEEPVNFSVSTTTGPSPGSPFKQRLLHGSGSGVYVGGTWTPKQNWPHKGEHLTFSLESSLALSERQRFGGGVPDEFYTIRNFISVAARLHHVGIMEFGAGFAWHDLHLRAMDVSSNGVVRKISDNYLPFAEVGIGEDGGLIQYGLSAQVNWALGDGYGFFVVKSHLMVSNIIGVDFRYFKALRSTALPLWHYDNYIAISPLIRINY
jgi:hypothetical protein